MTRLLPSSLRDKLYESIMSAIITNHFAPGEELHIDKLAAEYGVSTTPIREALVRLEGMGLVVWTQNRGAQVPQIALGDIVDIWEVRSLLEPFAARNAAKSCALHEIIALCDKLEAVLSHPEDLALYIESDIELHGIFVKCMDNRILHSILSRLNKQYLRIRYASWDNPESPKPEVVKEITKEHLAIATALRARNHVAVSEELRKHLVNGRARTLEALSAIKKD